MQGQGPKDKQLASKYTVAKPLLRAAPAEHDDGSRVEDQFRRAAFNWAMSTKRLVESAGALGSTRVAHAALADIEYASEMLNKLFIPRSNRIVGEPAKVTADDVRASVAGVTERILAPVLDVPEDTQAPVKIVVSRTLDLSAPVHAKGGKMLWAEADCTACPSKAHERCRNADGTFREKPHEERKSTPGNEG